jgi:hypothetical protein
MAAMLFRDALNASDMRDIGVNYDIRCAAQVFGDRGFRAGLVMFGGYKSLVGG